MTDEEKRQEDERIDAFVAARAAERPRFTLEKQLVLQGSRPGPRLVAMTGRHGLPPSAPYTPGDEIIGVRAVLRG